MLLFLAKNMKYMDTHLQFFELCIFVSGNGNNHDNDDRNIVDNNHDTNSGYCPL